MSMKKFTLGKLLNNLKDEQRQGIVAIVERTAQEKGVDVVDLDAIRVFTANTEEINKAAQKFEGEPTIEAGSRIFPMMVSTRQLDRDGEVVMPKGLDLKEWKKTGVVIPGHNYGELPIAKAVWVGVNDFGVKMHFEAAPTDDGDKIHALSKFMPLTASIGMGPGEYIRSGTPEFDKAAKKMLAAWPEFTDKTLAGLRGIISKAVLWEVSIVSVPANPNAVQTALAKSAMSDEDKGVIRKTLDIEAPKDDDPRDDIIQGLKGEVRDLKAKVDQLIEKDVVATEAQRLLAEELAKHTVKPVVKRSIEVVHQRSIEVVKQPDVAAHVKLAVDMQRGRV